MELVWSTSDFTIASRSYVGFPILLWDSMNSCVPANRFFRYYLLRGAIASKKSWPSIGRALYDFFSFLQAHELDWRDVELGEAKSLVAAYRDYCLEECKLARSTTRQRLLYVCKFYAYTQDQGWVIRLPFNYEERTIRHKPVFFAHIDARGGKTMANDIMPRMNKILPKFLSIQDIKILLATTNNPHHRMMLRFGLQTGLRREEIASFPLAYIFNPEKSGKCGRNIRICLDPKDGHGILTKGSKPRDIYISFRLMSDLHLYAVQVRGERASLSRNQNKPLFLNQYGEPYADDGKGIERIIRKIGSRVDIKVYPHMLRHTYATHTLSSLQKTRSTIDPLVFLQRQLGHSSVLTTMIYLHLVNELADDAVLAYDDELNTHLDIV